MGGGGGGALGLEIQLTGSFWTRIALMDPDPNKPTSSRVAHGLVSDFQRTSSFKKRSANVGQMVGNIQTCLDAKTDQIFFF